MSTERIVELFSDLVRIDSPTRHEAAVAEALAAELRSLGCDVAMDDAASATGSDSGNLIATLPGDRPQRLVLSAHMDTVGPGVGIEPIERDGVIYSAGETVLGADDKAGIAACIEAVRRVVEARAPRPTVTFLFTVAEETGLNGAKALDPSACRGDLCLVLDAAGDPGSFVVAAPTHFTFSAEFTGKAAHAGVAPEQGISAIAMAAQAVAGMRLGRVDADTTANVGSIEGGSATNIVTPRVVMTGECRSLDRATVEALKAEMTDQMREAARSAGGEVAVEWELQYEGFRHDPADPWLAMLMAAARDVGLEPATFETGGGSDANIIAATGTPTYALGCGMRSVHTIDEHIAVADLEAMAALLVAVCVRLAAEG